MCRHYSAKDIMTFRQATGLGVMDAKNFLLTKPPLLCDKILLAYKLKQSRIQKDLSTKIYLYDPIEDDPKYTEIFKEIRQKVNITIEAENHKMINDLEVENKDFFSRMIMMSNLHRTAEMTKKYLLEEYNIQYFSIIEMNPSIIFN